MRTSRAAFEALLVLFILAPGGLWVAEHFHLSRDIGAVVGAMLAVMWLFRRDRLELLEVLKEIRWAANLGKKLVDGPGLFCQILLWELAWARADLAVLAGSNENAKDLLEQIPEIPREVSRRNYVGFVLWKMSLVASLYLKAHQVKKWEGLWERCVVRFWATIFVFYLASSAVIDYFKTARQEMRRQKKGSRPHWTAS